MVMGVKNTKQYTPRIAEKIREMSEHLQIYGEVIIRQGDKIIAVARNKFVGQALISLCNMFSSVAITSHTDVQAMNVISLFRTDYILVSRQTIGNLLTMRLGSDTVTATTKDMIALVNVQNVAPTSIIISRDNPSAGVWRAIYTAVWNAGIVSGTVGEIGLFCDLQKTLGTNTLTLMDVTSTLWSRLSSASGDFGSFTIDPTKPLSVEWRIVFQF